MAGPRRTVEMDADGVIQAAESAIAALMLKPLQPAAGAAPGLHHGATAVLSMCSWVSCYQTFSLSLSL